jgi:hypothetical protein
MNKINFMPLPCKVCISRENSEKIQKELLINNFRWVNPENKVLKNAVCIFIYKDKIMRYGSHASTLNEYELDFTIIEEYNFMKYLGIV